MWVCLVLFERGVTWMGQRTQRRKQRPQVGGSIISARHQSLWKHKIHLACTYVFCPVLFHCLEELQESKQITFSQTFHPITGTSFYIMVGGVFSSPQSTEIQVLSTGIILDLSNSQGPPAALPATSVLLLALLLTLLLGLTGQALLEYSPSPVHLDFHIHAF